ncbi:MAG: molecular chaperone HtpG, partial [Clostridia bacterium]|nr:molecular chaperone HtpG [Clostridia bacterium]
GADGYTVTECDKPTFGTEILLRIKADTEDEKYSEFLEEYRIRSLVKKYSDYIRYPIKMEVTKSRKKEDSENEYESYRETETLNSMVPLWKRTASEVTKEEYNAFYTEKFYDYEPPLCTVTQKSEGTVTYNALMFVPSHAPFNYYTKDYERGLELYSSGVLIMERCADLLPEYFGFVRGVVDSADLSLNISREMLQHDRQLGVMAKAIEKKIKQELSKLMNSEREKYERFFDAFGIQLKYGIYSDYGMHKDTLVDLILFHSSKENKYVSLKEYTDAMTDGQKYIYYATGESAAKIEMLPQLEAMKARGYEVLYLTDDVDEFTLKVIGKYSDKEFKNITSEAEDLATEDAKESVKRENEGSKEMLELMKEAIGKVSEVRFTASLVKHPVCLSSKGELSVGMEKVLSKMPGADEGAPKAEVALEINSSHPISNTLKALYETDREKLKKYAKILYSVASMISGVSVDNPLELCELVSELMI